MRTSTAFRRTLVLLIAAGMGAFLGCSEDGAGTAPSGTLDTVAPLAPVPAAARLTRGALDVRWLPNSEPDVVGYNVYAYSPDPTRISAYSKMNPTPITTTKYTTYLGSPVVEWARVSAVDRAGNESALSTAFLVRDFPVPDVDGGPQRRPVDAKGE